MTIKAVSFDVWDTLLKLKPFYLKIAQEVAAYDNIDSTTLYRKMLENYNLLKKYRKKGLIRNDDVVNHCLELSSQKLGISVESLRMGVTRAILEISPSDIVHVEAVQTLSELNREGKIVVTLGNLIFWPGAYNRILLERAKLTGYFKLQLYADDLRHSKPSKEAFQRLCETIKLKPEEVVHVGDNRSEDFEGALKFGLYAIWVKPSFRKGVEVEGKGATVNTIGRVPEAITFLDEGKGCCH
ncbi:MAG: HAD family hydrolase [Nitrososphaeria archaeon]